MKLVIITSLLYFASWSATAQDRITSVSGKFLYLGVQDTITLKVYRKGYFNNSPGSVTAYRTAASADGRFTFKLRAVDNLVYFDLTVGKLGLYTQLLAAGDQYVLHTDKIGKQLHLLGLGSEKANVASELREVTMSIKNRFKRDDPEQIINNFKLKDSIFLCQLTLLNLKKESLGEQIYQVLLADIVAENVAKSYYITHYLKGAEAKPYVHVLKDYVDPKELTTQIGIVSKSDATTLSFAFVPNMLYKYRFDSCFMREREYKLENCYTYFSESYKGGLRTKFLVYLANSSKAAVQEKGYADSLMKLDLDPFYRSVLERLRSRFKVGSSVFPFQLTDEKGKEVSLQDLKGKVLLIDFWYTGCPACPQMVPYLEMLSTQFSAENFVILSVSVDKDVTKWKGSLKIGHYTTNGAKHLYTGGLGVAHPLISYYAIHSYPYLLLIDSEGKLGQIPVDPRVDSGDDLKRLIRKYLAITP